MSNIFDKIIAWIKKIFNISKKTPSKPVGVVDRGDEKESAEKLLKPKPPTTKPITPEEEKWLENAISAYDTATPRQISIFYYRFRFLMMLIKTIEDKNIKDKKIEDNEIFKYINVFIFFLLVYSDLTKKEIKILIEDVIKNKHSFEMFLEIKTCLKTKFNDEIIDNLPSEISHENLSRIVKIIEMVVPY
jgi:hypothetical protein